LGWENLIKIRFHQRSTGQQKGSDQLALIAKLESAL
jgi:hypothetical protein